MSYSNRPYCYDSMTLEIHQGDDYAVDVEVLETDGTPSDLTGYIARAQIRSDVAERAPGPPMIEMSATINANIITLSTLHTETLQLTRDSYSWDLEILSPNNAISTIAGGSVQVLLEVTRA